MRRNFLLGIMSLLAAVNMSAAYNLTATNVTIQDVTIDKNNFFVTFNASGSNNEYEVAFDVWPSTHSAIGSFSRADGTISYVNCYVHQTKEGQKKVDYWYYGEYESTITLTIVKKDATTCTLSGSIEAAYNSMETFIIAPVDFEYNEDGIDPGEEENPYRFEPTEPTTIDFTADVIAFREREGFIEVTLNEMANESYDWIELRLLSNELSMPAGTYTIDNSGAEGSLTASKGYLGVQKDDPCYVAIRGDKEDWGQYTPYYLVGGSVTVSYNAKTDSIFFSGTAQSYYGSTIRISAKGLNPLYDPYSEPREPENVDLAIDTVIVTYRSDLSDEATHLHRYTFHFTQATDFPEVIVDIIMPTQMALTAGTYTLADDQLKGLELFQNQTDFNTFFYGGVPYDFVTAELTLAEAGNGRWSYTMLITDDIGSEYRFNLTQDPHIVLYPVEDDTDPKEVPFQDESQTQVDLSLALDAIVWDDKTVSKDGVLDIHLTYTEPNEEGLYPYVHLGMYTDVSYPAAGTYPINGSEENGSFSASMGRYGNVLIPCYVMMVNASGVASAVWYLTEGTITVGYDEAGAPVLSGEGTSHYGSTIRFSYPAEKQGVEEVRGETANAVRSEKILRNGELIIIRGGAEYNVLGIYQK